MKHKRLLFAYLRTGGGHIAPAKAVSEYILEKYYETCDIIMSDFFNDIGAYELDRELRQSMNVMLKHPVLVKLGHAFISLFPHAVKLWETQKFKSIVSAASTFVAKQKPDIIICTHGFVAFTLEKVRKKYRQNFTLITLGTDPLSSHIFSELLQHQDHYIVASEYPRNRLIRAGISPEKITLLPFPIDRRFTLQHTPDQKISTELGVDPTRKTLLVSFGGQGVGNIEAYINALITAERALNVIIVCGRNEVLRQKISNQFSFGKTGKTNIIPLGFVDNMPDLVALSDFCFIKPGPSTTFENMIMQKPIIFYESAAHIEDTQVKFAQAHGIGHYAGKQVRKFMQAVTYYLDEDGLKITRDNYRKVNLTNGTEMVGDYICQTAKELQ